MPVFTKLDTSLKERIVVINFPYTFKTNPDPLEPYEKLKDISLKMNSTKKYIILPWLVYYLNIISVIKQKVE